MRRLALLCCLLSGTAVAGIPSLNLGIGFFSSAAANKLSVLLPQDLAPGASGAAYSQSGNVIGSALTLPLTSASVSGISWMSATVNADGSVTVSGTAGTAGTYTGTVTVYDSANNYGTVTVTCVIS